MLSGQFAGAVGFALIVCIVGALAWSLVAGSLSSFRYLAMAFGVTLAITTAVLLISIMFDVLGRYERPATVLAISRGREETPSEQRVDRRTGQTRFAVDVHFTYEASGQPRHGRRYAPVDLLLTSAEIDPLIERLHGRNVTAYVSRFNPDNAVLDRALGTRAAAAVVAAVGAVLLLLLLQKIGQKAPSIR
jgi:hypothetical protein